MDGSLNNILNCSVSSEAPDRKELQRIDSSTNIQRSYFRYVLQPTLLKQTDSRLSAALPDTCECYMIDYTGEAEEEKVEERGIQMRWRYLGKIIVSKSNNFCLIKQWTSTAC